MNKQNILMFHLGICDVLVKGLWCGLAFKQQWMKAEKFYVNISGTKNCVANFFFMSWSLIAIKQYLQPGKWFQMTKSLSMNHLYLVHIKVPENVKRIMSDDAEILTPQTNTQNEQNTM
jgi:hypothetical protein